MAILPQLIVLIKNIYNIKNMTHKFMNHFQLCMEKQIFCGVWQHHSDLTVNFKFVEVELAS